MISNDFLIKVEPELKDLLQARYGIYSWETDFGMRILQAARISLFLSAQTDEEAKTLLRNKESMLKCISAEIRYEGRPREWVLSLEDTIDDLTILKDKISERDRLLPRDDLTILHKGKIIYVGRHLTSPQIESQHSIVDLERSILVQHDRVETLPRCNHHLSSKAEDEYFRTLPELYEMIRGGRLSSWKNLVRGNRSKISFFDFEPNARGIIRYATEKYVLPFYKCSLNDLPLQDGLAKKLKELKFEAYLRKRSRTLREFFLGGYPEMRDSPHWHQARWCIDKSNGLTSEEEQSYFRFKCDYIFRYRLGCQTKQDVLNTLDDFGRLSEAITAEKISRKVLNYSPLLKQKIFRIHPWTLVSDLEGDMYDIKPWELRRVLPKRTFLKPDGSRNRERIEQYVLWAHQNYGIYLESPKNMLKNAHIPHYNKFGYATANEIREICEQKNFQANETKTTATI